MKVKQKTQKHFNVQQSHPFFVRGLCWVNFTGRLTSAMAHKNQLIPAFLQANRLCQQQITDWHAIRCLSHCPAAAHASEVSLKAKMSICPPGWCKSSPRKNSSLPNSASPALTAQPSEVSVCNPVFLPQWCKRLAPKCHTWLIIGYSNALSLPDENRRFSSGIFFPSMRLDNNGQT